MIDFDRKKPPTPLWIWIAVLVSVIGASIGIGWMLVYMLEFFEYLKSVL